MRAGGCESIGEGRHGRAGLVPAHENGKYVAYGTSASGSEISTLHIIETTTAQVLPDTIERTRAAAIAWKPDDSGFYYTRYPKPGEVAAGTGDVQPARLLSPAGRRS